MRLIHVVEVECLEPFRLRLVFNDGSRGEADLEADLAGPLAPLRDLELWRQARVDMGTVCWGDAYDLAPEFLYARAHGLPLPGSFEDAEANQMTVALRELRRLAGRSQAEVAEAMGVAQGDISRLEARLDMKVSTIERYVKALGGEVEIVARFGDRSMRLHLG